jgi:hypothetical protein
MVPSESTAMSDARGHLTPWIGRALEVGGGIVPALRTLGAELPARRRPAWEELCATLAAGDAERAIQALRSDPDTWIPLLTAAAPGATTGDGTSEAAFLARAVDVVVKRENDARWWLPLVYPLIVLLVAIAVTSLLAVLVVPVFEQIFFDFGSRLPLLTEALLLFARVVRGGWGWLVAAVIAAAVLWLTADRWWPSWLQWHGSRFVQSGRFARYAADLRAAGLPQAVAIAVASRAVEPGDRPPAASPPSWLSATVCHAIAEEMPAASRVRLLDRIATCHDLRLSASRSWFSWCLGPVAVFITGFVVFLMVLALFMPLVKLIVDLS